MKNKTRFLTASCLLAGLTFTTMVNAQNTWKVNGNNLNPGDFLGSKNYTDLNLI